LLPGETRIQRARGPIARYALLVDKTHIDKLCDAVHALGASVEHIAIALSGPMPPFSFRPDLVARNQVQSNVDANASTSAQRF
jgi:Gas vesicle synthesis protein GvpL/GvpF